MTAHYGHDGQHIKNEPATADHGIDWHATMPDEGYSSQDAVRSEECIIKQETSVTTTITVHSLKPELKFNGSRDAYSRNEPPEPNFCQVTRFPVSRAPLCRKCGEVCSRIIARSDSKSGNAGRPWYGCAFCGKRGVVFRCWDDEIGISQHRPRCDCTVPTVARYNVKKAKTCSCMHDQTCRCCKGMEMRFWRCAVGGCRYYSKDTGELRWMNEKVMRSAVMECKPR